MNSGQDTTIHGSIEFPIEIYEEYITDNTRHSFWHWHNSIQFGLIEEGNIIFNINNKKVELSKGDFLFINSGILHNMIPADTNNNNYLCINVEPQFLYAHQGSIINNNYFDPILENNKVDYCRISKNDIGYDILYNSLNKVIKSYYDNEYLETYISILLIWNTLYKYYFLHNNHYNNDRIKNIIRFIKDNYQHSITLDDIADNVGLNKNYLCRYFKKELNCTIFDYLTNYRIIKSIDYLSQDLTITEISNMCGFNSTSFFIKTFKRNMKISPNNYRKTKR